MLESDAAGQPNISSQDGGNSGTEPIIRNCQPQDLPQIRAIYNHFILTSVVTFDEEPLEVSHWQEKYELTQKLNLPFLVMTSTSGQVLGFAYCTPWRQKSAYKQTAEDTIYLAPEATGQKLGEKLLGSLLAQCREAGLKEIIAVIADRDTEPSMKLHGRFGFTNQGHLKNVGFKFGQPVGVYLMQLSL